MEMTQRAEKEVSTFFVSIPPTLHCLYQEECIVFQASDVFLFQLCP